MYITVNFSRVIGEMAGVGNIHTYSEISLNSYTTPVIAPVDKDLV